MEKKILLIDGNSIISRAFYAIPLLTNNKGIHTNAIYGFLNILFKFLDEEKPNYLGIAFDLSAPTFRHDMFKEYKSNRKPTPDELKMQFPILKELLKKMNIKIFEIEGYEADDVLGTLAKISENNNILPTVVSGDKDLLQLATDKTTIKIPLTKGGKTEISSYNSNDVLNVIGVTPKEYIDLKGLMGDSSDNYPGVPSIGEKTALKIIKEYKTIENAISNYEKITPKKASQNLNDFREQALFCKKLATIFTDIPLEFSLNEIEIKNIYTTDAFKYIKELNIKSFNTRFSDQFGNDINKNDNFLNYVLIQDLNLVDDIINECLNHPIVAYSLIKQDNNVFGISFSFKEFKSYFIVFDNLTENIVLKKCQKFFNSDIKKISLNSKFEKVYLERLGIVVKNVVFDAALAGYLINSSKTSYFYNDLAYDFLNEIYLPSDEIFGKGKSKKQPFDLEKNDLLNYGSRQSDILFRTYPIIDKMLVEKNMSKLYYNIELPLVDVLKDMELNGIKVNRSELIKYKNMLEEKLSFLTNNIYELAKEEFNINSPQQLGIILFEKLSLKGSKKTKTGYSTEHDVLEKLKHSHKIIPLILEYRTISKLQSTYAEGLLNVLSDNDKIYSTFNQFITTTGRISSTEPNLQNIPIKVEVGRELRKVFIPSKKDYVFIDADYSQIELRVLAHIANDETLINAFINNEDIHKLTASEAFNISYDEVTKEQRNNAKAVNFGIVYGISAFSLSQDLDITKKEADKYIDAYFKKYPKIKLYLNQVVEDAEIKGYAETLFNRRRNIPELSSSNFVTRGFGKRVAMNMPIQGTSADIIKISMIKVHRRLKDENIDGSIILQVHDELLIEVNKKDLEKAKDILKFEMENAISLKVPLIVDLNVGDNWYDTK